MRINLIELIKTGNIFPFKWNSSESDFIKLFPEWKNRITELKRAQYPYIEIDAIEFYFDNDYYKGLSEIVIKNWSLFNEYQSDFFDKDWLRYDLTFSEVIKKIDNLKWSYTLAKGKFSNAPMIFTNKNVVFSFDKINENESDSELQKIYIRREKIIIENKTE